MAKRIAIAGATGAVGLIVRQLLEQRDFPYETITFLASKRSAGSTIQFKGEDHTVQLLDHLLRQICSVLFRCYL